MFFHIAREAQRRAHLASAWPRSDKNSRPIICLKPCETEGDMMCDGDVLTRWAELQEAAHLAWAQFREYRLSRFAQQVVVADHVSSDDLVFCAGL